MRISDWSSDVCSSDLVTNRSHRLDKPRFLWIVAKFLSKCPDVHIDGSIQAIIIPFGNGLHQLDARFDPARDAREGRSEERSLGKECVSPVMFRWSAYH